MLQTDTFELIIHWITAPTNRERRRHLETHLELLAIENDHLLMTLLAQFADAPAEQQHIQFHMSVLQQARQRGWTQEAVRAAYVDACGGLVLDVPNWLAAGEQSLVDLLAAPQTPRKAVLYQTVLGQALEKVQRDGSLAPEIAAELAYHLGQAFMQGQGCNTYCLARAVYYYRTALAVYTADRYPLRHAKVQADLVAVTSMELSPEFT